MGHDTNSPQQLSDGAIGMKKLTVPGGSTYKQFTTTVMEECEEKSSLCPMGHHTNSPQQQSEGPF